MRLTYCRRHYAFHAAHEECPDCRALRVERELRDATLDLAAEDLERTATWAVPEFFSCD